ncbi:hypothetical protein MLD38_023547 [Melastoma candidum]|uniref:Uncharacterized protein n=1 Tax=Melastoma candidum TaxID=119954 RepID=A0ACB9NQI3_9MYRT|nr:hypothetical protein MLD38_023547 [Melastoma candidum]
MLNELALLYGDSDQNLASYFLQALFCKAFESGNRRYKTLVLVAERSHIFDTPRKLTLKFQEDVGQRMEKFALLMGVPFRQKRRVTSYEDGN